MTCPEGGPAAHRAGRGRALTKNVTRATRGTQSVQACDVWA